MRKQSSPKGRPRKVIRQQDCLLSFTGKNVTSHAGLAIVARAMEHFGVRQALRRIGRDLDGAARHCTAEMLEQLVALRFLGGDALDDTRLLDEVAIKGLFGWRGVVVEQVIEEVKNDLAAGRIKTAHFWANEALFLTGLIAYNRLNCIRRLALPKALRTARLKRIGLLLLDLGANVVRHGRRTWLKISRDYPLRAVFYRAMAAMSPG